MDEAGAAYLRACAIPHQLDLQIFRVLVPGLDEAAAEARYKELGELSLIRSVNGGLALHDQARKYLFGQWLANPQGQFVVFSQRLADYFSHIAGQSHGERLDTAWRQAMFHRIGATADVGIEELERLCRRARKAGRLSECETLITLAHEYDRVLNARQLGVIAYHEAKLAADRRQWPAAETLFRNVADNTEVSSERRVKALDRLGLVFSSQRRWREAIQTFELALERARSGGEHELPFILHDLGVAYRESGDLAKAQALLEQAIREARATENVSCMAAGYNSLGTVRLKLRQVQQAISDYKESLTLLNQLQDENRAAQVYNNLGAAYSDLADWKTSGEMYTHSLQIKENAGDTLGQAKSLSNLMPVYQNENLTSQAIDAGKRAISMFEEMRDPYDAAVVKRNLAKLYRRLDNREEAVRAYTDAIESLRASDAANEAAGLQQEFNDYLKPRSFPWWGCGIIVFSLLILLGIFTVIAFLDSR